MESWLADPKAISKSTAPTKSTVSKKEQWNLLVFAKQWGESWACRSGSGSYGSVSTSRIGFHQQSPSLRLSLFHPILTKAETPSLWLLGSCKNHSIFVFSVFLVLQLRSLKYRQPKSLLSTNSSVMERKGEEGMQMESSEVKCKSNSSLQRVRFKYNCSSSGRLLLAQLRKIQDAVEAARTKGSKEIVSEYNLRVKWDPRLERSWACAMVQNATTVAHLSCLFGSPLRSSIILCLQRGANKELLNSS
jgi:hypothetical protein